MCHQTVSLIARHLEAHGIPTLCLSSALDITESAQPPRSLFVDYPLGHTSGKPFDTTDQISIISAAISAFQTIDSAGELVSFPNAWSDDESWRDAAIDVNRGDTRQTRDTTPRYERDEDRVLAEALARRAVC